VVVLVGVVDDNALGLSLGLGLLGHAQKLHHHLPHLVLPRTRLLGKGAKYLGFHPE